jgi:hypothetical protein
MYTEPTPDFTNHLQIPNFDMRLATRFSVTSNLLVYLHDVFDRGIGSFTYEMRPSTDPDNPSVYRLDFDPIDVPFLQTTTTNEGIMSGFEAYSLDTTDNGIIGMKELEIGCYPASLLKDEDAIQTRIYAPSETDAGDLKIFNSVSDYRAWNYTIANASSGVIGDRETTGVGTYSEGPFGFTLDSRDVPSTRVAYMEHFINATFDGALNYDQRIRSDEGKIYKVRYHVTSTQPTSQQAWLWLRTRSLHFAYSHWLQLSGAWGSNNPSSRAITLQSIPGVGCLNPDQMVPGENGGWYTLIFNSPMNKDIRPEFAEGVPLDIRMPLLSSQPGPGDDLPSIRDIRVDVTLYDTMSAGTGKDSEQGLFTVDRIEVRSYNSFPD